MKTFEFGTNGAATVTQMRAGGEYGSGSEQLVDGNMIPRLCEFAGAGACAQACQLKLQGNPEHQPKLCAEENIVEALENLTVNPENFAMVAATKDRVGFGDNIEELGASKHADGYTVVPECNAFFFRPGIDKTVNLGRRLTNVAMRMADCGDVVYSFQDSKGDDVLGIAHFSRTNMRGPSAYVHELDGRQVSWGEYVLGSAMKHYGADPQSVKIKLVAAVEGENFIHHYTDENAMEKHFPGWNELGFMHPEGKDDFDCLINYREMIQWQLRESIQAPHLQLSAEQIEAEAVVDTGNLSLGHASHHAATKGTIAHGRDLYILGLNRRETIASRIEELRGLQNGRRWAMNTFGEMSDDDYRAFEDIFYEGERELRQLYVAQEELR